MGVFNAGGVGFDLGSCNVTIYLENEGVVLREASYLLTSADDSMDILAVGRDARQMLGRIPRDVVLETPVSEGAVGDADQAAAMIQAFSERAIGKRRALEKSRMVVFAAEFRRGLHFLFHSIYRRVSQGVFLGCGRRVSGTG